MSYLSSILDIEKTRKNELYVEYKGMILNRGGLMIDVVGRVAEEYKDLAAPLHECIEAYTEMNARNFVDLKSLFSFMNVKNALVC